jgi:hypothetical protein
MTKRVNNTYMDASVMSTYYLLLRANFQHKYRFNLILPLVCYIEGNLKNVPFFKLGLTYILALN